MNKFMNDPAKFVPEMLEGIYLANPSKLKYNPKFNCIYRADRPHDDFVSIIQGSGSGHEPAHVMVVGAGMLDAACPGNVFSAPPSEFPFEVTKLMNSKKGVLHIVNNYSGDRMVWDMAREMAEAEGMKIGVVLMDDDVAVVNSAYTVGRRGVAGHGRATHRSGHRRCTRQRSGARRGRDRRADRHLRRARRPVAAAERLFPLSPDRRRSRGMARPGRRHGVGQRSAGRCRGR